ncbi:MAG: hypothetical protein F6K58_00055 [Symploca sp. SIO2E9]|nr:hypothetical protein [Symploca sp. SIO2E9]
MIDGGLQTRRYGDAETRRRGDAEMRRHGDTEFDWLSRTCGDNKILYIVGWVRCGS